LSLSSLLKNNSELRKSIPDIKSSIVALDGSTFNWKMPILVPSIGASHEAGLIGTAFDYVARAILAQTLERSSVTMEESLIAEKALDLIINFRGIPTLPQHFEYGVMFCGDNLKCAKYDDLDDDRQSIPFIDFVSLTLPGFKKYSLKMFVEALQKRNCFIETGSGLDDLIESSILFAEFDTIYRTQTIPAFLAAMDHFWQDIYGTTLVKPMITHIEMVKNIKTLAQVFQTAISNISPETCKLNPSFGKYSTMVGGADADFIIDDIIVDIKTNKKLGYKNENFAQLLAYAAMGRKIGMKLNRASIYYARYGEFSVIDLDPLESFLEQYLTNIESITQKSINMKSDLRAKFGKKELDNNTLIKPYNLYNSQHH